MSAIITNFNGTYVEHLDTMIVNPVQQQGQHITRPVAEDISEVDTSFFCNQRFAEDIIEKNLREAIRLASSKADACRRVMALETVGYIVLSNVTDERKAELINPFAAPKYTLTGEDFRKARNS